LILQGASTVYGAVASWRRQWYGRDPHRARRLARPVVSVGNLRTGGSGKTPIVAYIARLLLEYGEHPAVLTRGYARRVALEGVTVVSDSTGVLADLSIAGDEPLMLARALPGVPVLVGSNRFLSGRLAETRFGATVHLLDDGFQHVALRRDVDLVLIDGDDLRDRVIPAGRLREPITAAAAADAVLVTHATSGVHASLSSVMDELGHVLGATRRFGVSRTIGAPPPALAEQAVFAVAGIGRPERFFGDLAAAGWRVAGSLAFRDHHPFTQRDVERIIAAAHASGATAIVTTEKDAVRLAACEVSGLALTAVPLSVVVEPPDAFREWLLGRLAAVHQARRTADVGVAVEPDASRLRAGAPSPDR
jgi:tetraacyldisaccharide 4'-kinase